GGAQRLHGGRVVGAVEGVDLGQGGGEAPAVEDGVVLGDRPVEGVVVEDVHGHAAQRSGRQVEGVAMLASYVLRQRRLLIVGAAQVGHRERDLGGGVDELHGFAVAAQVEGGTQDRMPLHDPCQRVPE